MSLYVPGQVSWRPIICQNEVNKAPNFCTITVVQWHGKREVTWTKAPLQLVFDETKQELYSNTDKTGWS